MGEKYILLLNDQEIQIQFNSKMVLKLGENISDSLISFKKYFIRSKVTRTNFNIFLDFLNGKIDHLPIDLNNYYDYFQLSYEFNNVLSNYLSKPEFDDFGKLSFLKTAIENENTDKQLCESYISEHLDYYLQYHPNDLSKIPYTTLYNIFQHEKRILNNHENAYQFIKQILNESNVNGDKMKKNICILLGTLDGNKLNEESLKESISMKEKHFGFVPKIDSTIFNSFNDIVSNLKVQLQEQQIQIFNNIKVYFDSKFDSITKEIKETKNFVTNLSERIRSIENNIQMMLNKNDDFQNKIQSIMSQIDDLKDNQNQILQRCENNNNNFQHIPNKIVSIESNINKISDANNEIQNKMQNMTNQINEIKDKNIQISQKCDNSYNSIQQIPSKIKCIESETKEIFNRVSETLDISIALFGLSRGIIHRMTEECGGNVSDKRRVNVTSSSCRCGNLPKYAADFNNDQTGFESDFECSPWLKYDFISRKVCPSHYFIKSRNKPKGSNHPRNWVIEGSNTDSNDWTILDERNDITSLDDSCSSQLFTIQKTDAFYRYLRIRLSCFSVFDMNYLEISALEYFGSIQ